MRVKLSFAFALLLVCAPVVAQHDHGHSHGEAAKKPQMDPKMMEAMMEGMLKVMAKPENIELLATFTRRYYEALIQKGFTKDEALQIVVAAGIPRMPSGPR